MKIWRTAGSSRGKFWATSNGQEKGDPLKTRLSTDQTEAEKLHHFAVRANSILASIECQDEQRPKLREAIIETVLWDADPAEIDRLRSTRPDRPNAGPA